ncbi:hypothetical protein M3Y94_00711000 [Aphelenchoides besseyi]|nr:hypothetical protein M3Y94_00711000 [Aphelenchoides besseyi]
MRFWLSITVLLLVLTCLVSSTKNQSKRQHGHKAARSVHHAPAHKSAHKPTHNVAHKAVHKKAHKKTAPRRGSLSRLRVAKKNNIRARAIRAGTICGDRALNCQVVDSLCGEKAFTTVLTDYCRMNCGFCPPPQDKCKDKLPSQCKKWVGEGFCNSSFLSKQMIRSLCAKSCSMCGGKTNCNLGPNRFLSECLTTTCKNRKYQRNSGCKKYCKQHPNVCGSRPKPPQPPPSADCDADDKKFSTECLPTTCPKAENRNAQQCQQYCTQNPTVCGGTPPTDQTGEQCDASPADVGPTCLHHTCRKNDKKAIPECVEFCSADANLPDPACVGVEPKPDATCDDATNEFTDNCYKTTCRKATKKTEAKCKEHCDADPAKPECAKS